MASKFARVKLRILFGGLLCTLIIATFWGVSLVLDGSPLASEIRCNCPNEAANILDKNQVNKGNAQFKENNTASHSLCVLVPFRDRFEELLEFAPHMNKFLLKQNIVHELVVINQLDRFRFNRASLINVGFLETRQNCDYIAMHDVDLLPLNEELRYDFPKDGPYHLAAPHLHPLYHYKTFVGGILLLQSKDFVKLNGLSNKYWGWGREDDEFFVRIKKARLKLSRPGNLTSGFKTFKHLHDRRKRKRDHDKFFDQREKTRRLDRETGLTSLHYTVDSKKQLTIDSAAVTLINIYLECDIDFTPWCLQAEDHSWYENRLKEKKEQAQQPKDPSSNNH
ncbi:beta-1,4-galactosyltransferase 7 [Elysia marginata]|uniref:Beta-1,4-galactosyltransferase n=1 Tax=Elysia marginata TaxID=1093978 RepID=A0AAV4FE77_9GAST|nr:beta-1,4-galactosyltransferase 7 [Elysia marginata]